MNDGDIQKNNTDFPSGIRSTYYMKMEIFSALIKHIGKKTKCKISCVKNFISVQLKLFGRNKRFVFCKPPGCDAMLLNPTARGKMIFKINPPDRVFFTWVFERSLPQ